MTRELAKIVESNDLIEFVKMDEFLEFINQDPPKKFITDHPLVKGVKTLPIDKVELMLTKIYQEWNVEIRREGQIANSVFTTIRLHYKHPITQEWRFQDGTAAVPIKTRSGKDASDMAAILNDAIQTGLPSAESFAIKDAADKLGRVFGKDLNRRNSLGFTPSYGTDEIKSELKTKKELLLKQLEEKNESN